MGLSEEAHKIRLHCIRREGVRGCFLTSTSLRFGSTPAPLRGECADMHLVDDEVLAGDPAPRPHRSNRSLQDRQFLKVRVGLPLETSMPGPVMPYRSDRGENDNACLLGRAGSTVRNSHRARDGALPDRGLRSRRQPRDIAAPRHGNARPRWIAARRRSAGGGRGPSWAKPKAPERGDWAVSGADVSSF
jgi:hypothetical protein